MVKNLPANAGDTGDVGSITGSGRSPGGGHGQRSLVGYSPRDRKERDSTEAAEYPCRQTSEPEDQQIPL